MSAEILDEVVSQQKNGRPSGLTSICSAHPYVLRGAIRHAVKNDLPMLIESTCNQVNQFGGYTGMTPGDFAAYVQKLVRENGFRIDRVMLGGDHLGPHVWQSEPAEVAMSKSEYLVQEYVHAGYVKLHIDASMRLGDDDPSRPLNVELACRRTARLVKAAIDACSGEDEAKGLRYVIGTEVPVPGGAREFESGVSITSPENVRQTIELTQKAFRHLGVESAWERVIAVVAQPGVEFGDEFVLDYDPVPARELRKFIEREAKLVFEVHSTDYQTREALRKLVQDHFAILKVGPRLTFAFREAVFALAFMENELLTGTRSRVRSNILSALDAAMLRAPQYWQKHFLGPPESQKLARKYSFSDRSRYYWQDQRVRKAFARLITNLSKKPLPLSLLSQFAPSEYVLIREGSMDNSPDAIILHRIQVALDDYTFACQVNS